MNNRLSLATNNPVAFTTINNLVSGKKIAHAFLFSASKNLSIESEPRYLMEKIMNRELTHDLNSYVDITVIDGKKGLISKDEVTNAVEKLQQTSLEAQGQKILLLKNIENGNVASLNSLLKFIEEPTPKTYIIMTTNHISGVLSTIRSRAIIINLRTSSQTKLVSDLQKHNIKHESALILSALTGDFNAAIALNSDAEMWKVVKKIEKTLESALRRPVKIYSELIPLITSTNYVTVLKILNAFFHDVWKSKEHMPLVFEGEKGLVQNYSMANFNYQRAIRAVNEMLTMQNNNFNFDLFKNKFAIELEQCYE